MSRDALDRALWELAIPLPDAAEERGLRVVESAFAQRRSEGAGGPESGSRAARSRGRPSLPRLVLGFALATLLAALLLSPAGAAVRGWVGDAFTSAPRPEPTLSQIPGGGRLLVQSGVGPWVVQPDGSRHLLGDYEEASWSPHGLFAAVVKGRTLSAVEPDGSPRWSLTAAARVGEPRWSPSGEQIAYRSGISLRAVAGDGSEDHLLAESTAVSPYRVAPSWSPRDEDALAYVSGGGLLHIISSDTGAELARARALHRITWMEWGAGGRRILEASHDPKALRLRSVRPRGAASRPTLGGARRLPIAAGATMVDAVLAPEHPLVAAVFIYWKTAGTHSEVVVYGPAGKPRTLLTVPGSLGQVAWSPDGRRLLVAWPGADQWLFLPIGRGRGRAVANVSHVFSSSFPRVEGWCCRR
jgi:hypothetical protein